MRATSNRELARQLGVSETAVRRAEKAGRIRREADGSWDPARVKAAWSDNTDQAQQRPARSGRPAVKRRSLKPVPEAAVGAVRDTLREHGEPIAAAGAMTFMQARTANEVLKAQERRVRLQRLKGELVDRAKAVAQVFRLARDERGQPDRVIHREARRQHADIVEMLDQRLAVERLAGPAWDLGLEDMGVHRKVIARRELGRASQEVVRAALRPRGRRDDPDPAVPCQVR